MKEKERHDKLENNYNLVWNEDSFTSAKKDFTTDQENSDQNGFNKKNLQKPVS